MTATTTPPYRTLTVFLLGVGALLVFLSFCALIAAAAVPLFSLANGRPLLGNQVATNTEVLSFVAFALGYGALLLVIGIGLRRSRTSTMVQLPSPLIFLAAFFLVLVIGQTILALNFATPYLFPIWHVLASLLFPLAAVAYAVRRLPPISVRSMLAQFSWGGLVTIALALVFELVIGIVIGIVAILAIALVLGTARLQELASVIRSTPDDTAHIMQLLTAQPLALVIVGLAVVVLFVMVVPLLEELLKATGPAILIARHVRKLTPPTPAQAVLWGIAAGAGYTFTENMFNGQGAVAGAGIANFWAATMILRAGTSLLHIVATATVSVGWYQALVNKKRSRMLLLLAAAVSAHATWNTAAVLLGGASALSGGSTLAAGVLGGCALLFLVGLFVGMLFWFWRLIRWAQPPPVEIITSSGTLVELKG